MKAKAIEHCDFPDEVAVKRWRKNNSLVAFLKAL